MFTSHYSLRCAGSFFRAPRSLIIGFFFFFSSRRRHTRYWRDWSSDVCSSDLGLENSFNMAVPYTMAYYFPTGLLGLGLTALLASFMSGMAGNVTAFNTVWTYDIYQSYIRQNADDRHYVNVGRIATVAGVLISIGTAYVVMAFESILDYLQLLHGIFLAPLFGVFLLGMFWRRATPWGGFAGPVAGTVGGLVIWGFELMGMLTYGSPMAGNLWRSWWGWGICVVTIIGVSLLTSRSRKSDDELQNLVWGLTEKKEAAEPAWYKKPWVLAVAALAITVALNIIFF